MPYIPHTEEDTRLMLEAIGVAHQDVLFDEIPGSLFYSGFQKIPAGTNEMQLMQEAQCLAEANRNGICFMGAGAYEHHIPAVVWDIASRGEFLTAYTPYQAEASQGTLQLLYEFQTMICELTGMEVANASMYDGATALAEAILMAVRIKKHPKVLIAGTLHPLYRDTLETVLSPQGIELIRLEVDVNKGITPLETLKNYTTQSFSALVIPQPNFFGCLEAVDELTNWALAQQILSIACVNPISLGVLKPPGAWGEQGVDIACGEGQPLGAPLASGGPYFGFLSTKMPYVRQMPGRIIGCTVDKEGQRGFTLTLQAREQHIRRAKATSNICTNQGLLVCAATIHMSLLGAEGLRQVASQCHQNAHDLIASLTKIKGVELVFSAPYFHEALVRLNKPVQDVLTQLAKMGINGGYPLASHYPFLENTLLVCATEMRTSEEIALYAHALAAILESEAI